MKHIGIPEHDLQKLWAIIQFPLRSIVVQSGTILDSDGSNGVYSVTAFVLEFDEWVNIEVGATDIAPKFEIFSIELGFGVDLLDRINNSYTHPEFRQLRSWPDDLDLAPFLTQNTPITGLHLLQSIDDSNVEYGGTTILFDSALIMQCKTGSRLAMSVNYALPCDVLISTSEEHIEQLYHDAVKIKDLKCPPKTGQKVKVE